MVGIATRGRRGLALALGLAVAFLGPAADEPAEATAAGDMRSLINAERAQAGKRVLRRSWKLARIARRHAVRMANEQNLHHNSRLAYQARRLSWSLLGENVGVGRSVDSLHRAFMNSSPHRRNILNGRFRKVGIGTAYGGGRLWVTVVFSD